MKFNLLLLLSLTTSLTSGFALSNPSFTGKSLLAKRKGLAVASPSSSFGGQAKFSQAFTKTAEIAGNDGSKVYALERQQLRNYNSIALRASGGGEVEVSATKKGLDFGLLSYFLFWYIGNYYYNITNKVRFLFSWGQLSYPFWEVDNLTTSLVSESY